MKNIDKIITYYNISDTVFYKDSIFKPFIELYLANKHKYNLKLFHSYITYYDRAKSSFMSFLDNHSIQSFDNNLNTRLNKSAQIDKKNYINAYNNFINNDIIDFRNPIVKKYFQIFKYTFVGLVKTKSKQICPLFIHYTPFYADNKKMYITGYSIFDNNTELGLRHIGLDNSIKKFSEIVYPAEAHDAQLDIKSLKANLSDFSNYSQNF